MRLQDVRLTKLIKGNRARYLRLLFTSGLLIVCLIVEKMQDPVSDDTGSAVIKAGIISKDLFQVLRSIAHHFAGVIRDNLRRMTLMDMAISNRSRPLSC